MLFHFQTNTVTFFKEDQEYFEKKIKNLEKMFGHSIAESDSIEVTIIIDKNKSRSGERFESSARIISPYHGKFYATISAENIRKCADELKDKLKTQIIKFNKKK